MSKSEQSYPTQYAAGVANRLKQVLDGACERWGVAGSIRRGRTRVHDVDIVAIPKALPMDALFGMADGIRTELDQAVEHLVSTSEGVVGYAANARGSICNGQAIKRLVIRHDNPALNGLNIDLYIADERTWATLLLIRTGSKEHNIYLCKLAQKLGWKLRADGSGLFNAEGGRIAGDSEASIFAALGLQYIEPAKREK